MTKSKPLWDWAVPKFFTLGAYEWEVIRAPVEKCIEDYVARKGKRSVIEKDLLPSEENGGEGSAGLCSHRLHIIYLVEMDHMTEKEYAHTLIHEVNHAIYYAMGYECISISDTGATECGPHTEATVEGMAQFQLQILMTAKL